MIRYPITIFLSAFLLFQVQPLLGKIILPWFGGTPAVWTACMLFFQVLLLLGYSYAHFVSSALPPRAVAVVHVLLLLASLVFLPVTPAANWKPTGSDLPVLRILALMLSTVGLPYFLLATTGPLLQESFHRETGRTPYRLYALSNIGSLLALLTYPFVFEPQLRLKTQILAWSAGYLLFVALGLWCAIAFARIWRSSATSVEDVAAQAGEGRPTIGIVMLWLALAACGSLMLLATTNQLCQEVTSVPFLWMLPLSLYLLTFIICFDHERWYHRGTFMVLLAVAVLATAIAMFEGRDLTMWQQLTAYSVTLFICCMVCHGELVKSKPAPRYATLFYLMVAAGGALGGLLVAVVAPLVLHSYLEYYLGLMATIILAFVASLARTRFRSNIPRPAWIFAGALGIALAIAIGVVLSRPADQAVQSTLESSRNFYGVLRVNREHSSHNDNGPLNELIHGTIQHGYQFIEPDKRGQPTTYYGHTSGVGLAIDRHPRRTAPDGDHTLRIGVVGLGCGTLAAYGRKGDYIRFYEINPEVVRLSDKYFTYRKDSPAEIDVVMGDARITMERELAQGHPQKFDVLAIDAFSSDAIPMHLLTKESVQLFLDELKPDGILCIHISNRFLDLESVVIGIAQELGWPCVFIDSDSDTTEGLNSASWVLLTRNWKFLADPAVAAVALPCWPTRGEPVLWTDDYGSLWQVLTQ